MRYSLGLCSAFGMVRAGGVKAFRGGLVDVVDPPMLGVVDPPMLGVF